MPIRPWEGLFPFTYFVFSSVHCFGARTAFIVYFSVKNCYSWSYLWDRCDCGDKSKLLFELRCLCLVRQSEKKLFNCCTYQKNVSIQSCHIFKKYENGRFIFFLDQIRPKWIKMDQIWSNWISHQSKIVKLTVLFLSFLDQTCPSLIKLDQTWSNLISSPI